MISGLAPLLLLGTMACGASAEVDADVARREAPVIAGETSGNDQDGTVWLAVADAEGRVLSACTGTLVASNLVVTARHCVSRVEESPIACDEGGRALLGGKIFEDFEASQIVVQTGSTLRREVHARGARIFREPQTSLCNSDIAIVLLDRKLDGVPVLPVRLERPPLVGDEVTVVGWGVTAPEDPQAQAMPVVRQQRKHVPILAVGANRKLSMATADKEFAIGESVCSGDSGGPAVDESTGAVIGVVARGGGGAPYDPAKDPVWAPCVDVPGATVTNVFARTDAFRHLFDQAFEASGERPLPEPPATKTTSGPRVAQQAGALDRTPEMPEEQASAAGCSLTGAAPMSSTAAGAGPWIVAGVALWFGRRGSSKVTAPWSRWFSSTWMGRS